MAVNFPTSPSLNDTHTHNGVTYKWDGTSWAAEGSTASYILPTATASVLGGIKVGNRLTINAGVLEADVQGGTYADADVDTHLNQSGPTSGHVLSWNGSDYAWVAQTTDTNTTTFLGLTDTPSAFTAGKWLKVNAGGTALEETDPPSSAGLSPRSTATATTATVAAGADINLDITGVAISYGILKKATTHPAWVVLYISQAARTADSTRAITTDPVPGSGVVAEVITVGDVTQVISPMLCGYNDESTPVTTVYAKVRNETTSSNTIGVTITFVPLEA